MDGPLNFSARLFKG